ncbi:MAG: ribosome biogenesis GTPase YlqF [Erysipelotrichaceae bacterium]|nr:ribosome biogenesis GTPase YlqF [Erysipelotrichaceae bacterium]
MADIQWFPGHMAKANREMSEAVKLVDIVIELRDARMPLASHNPNFDKLFNGKPRLIILNKADLADESQNKLWLNYFKEENTILVNSTHDDLKKIVVNKVQDILKEKIEKYKAKGIRKKVLKAIVVGIPNVGKSTFINNIVKKKVAKVENRPGVTKTLTWININEDLLLLDTPGVLWPKFENQNQAKTLALLGSINDDILDKQELTNYGLKLIKKNYPGLLNSRYDINEEDDDLLYSIGVAKNCLAKDNKIDYIKACEMVLNDIRSNKLGRVTYEKL